MKHTLKPYFMLFLPLVLVACASTPAKTQYSEQPSHQSIDPQCLRQYPKPEFNAQTMNSPEHQEWLNHMKQCQKRQR